MAKPISVDELAFQQDQFQVVDVRRRPAFDASSQMIFGAAWNAPEDVDNWSASLDRALPVVVYRVHGHQVSQGCADALQKAGFDAYFLESGFEKWVGEGKPVTMKIERVKL